VANDSHEWSDTMAPMSLRAGIEEMLSSEQRSLREENRTLASVITLVTSSLELAPMLQGVVDLATEATGCHACFIYLLEGDELVIRAGSPVFHDAVGRVRFSVEEGLTGWVARHRTPQFIRDQAMLDPRMKYVPELEEERFQSMVAVPILARVGDTIGVVVLHTEAPREFAEDTVQLLARIASLVSGVIENAQLYDRERRRVDVLTGLSTLAARVASAARTEEVAETVADALVRLLPADQCQVLRLDSDGETFTVLASLPPDLPAPVTQSAADLSLSTLGGSAGCVRAPWSGVTITDLLAVPLIAGERIGLLLAARSGTDAFGTEASELARAAAHLTAVAIKRAELIDQLTISNTIKDLFEALAAGATAIATTKARALHCNLQSPYLLVCAHPAGTRTTSSPQWHESAEAVGTALARLAPSSAIEAGPGPVRALVSPGHPDEPPLDELLAACAEIGIAHGAAVGLSAWARSPEEAGRAYREATDAAVIAGALLPDGGAIDYARVGAYRYLVHIATSDAPRDRMSVAVERLIAYDAQRRSSLLDTLERFLSDRRSLVDTAQALYVHPNTLRQRLARIEELTDLQLDREDLLSLELAIKLARLHGLPIRPPAQGEPPHLPR
jgi:GAF domain-containing protein